MITPNLEALAALLITLGAVVTLAWKFRQARNSGPLALGAWLQSVILVSPWLVFFGLAAAGINLGLAVMLLLLLIATGLYVWLGRRARRLEPQPSPTEGLSVPVAPLSPVEAIPDADLQLMRGIFSPDTFFATETLAQPQGVIFKGNLRGAPEFTYTQLSERLQGVLGNQYRLFLIPDPEGKPTVAILPRRSDPQPTGRVPQLLALGLAGSTFFTCAETVGLFLGFDLVEEPARFSQVLPLTLAVLGVLGAYEGGRRWAAARHGLRLSPPFFLPSWQIGSFGALTRFETLLPDPRALFDVSFSGPLAAALASGGLVVAGLFLSRPDSPFQVPTEFFQGSILVGLLARLVLGPLHTTFTPIHPLVVMGWMGLVLTALNLMPAGQLDGGRVVLAVYGRKTASRTTVATLVVLALASLVNSVALYWGAVIIFLRRDLERPSLNELVEVNDTRALLGLAGLFLMFTILFPLAPGLALRLGIGA